MPILILLLVAYAWKRWISHSTSLSLSRWMSGQEKPGGDYDGMPGI